VFSTDILADIGTSEALAYLKTLAKDTDNEVATDARDTLAVTDRSAGNTVDLMTIWKPSAL